LTDNSKLFDRIKVIWRQLITFLYTTLVNLNTFPLYRFGSSISRSKAKRLGLLATRLYIVLLIIGFVVLALYTIIQPQGLTNTFNNPSLSTYNNIIRAHNDTLQCPCSSISSTYDQIMKIEPVFHAVSTKDYLHSFHI
jgi:hypothetical protein